MAKEYFHFQNQYFQFNDEDFTMTIVSANEKTKDLSVQHLSELQFQAQLYSFRGNVLRSQAAIEEGLDVAMAGPHFEGATEEDFIAKKNEAITYITNNI